MDSEGQQILIMRKFLLTISIAILALLIVGAAIPGDLFLFVSAADTDLEQPEDSGSELNLDSMDVGATIIINPTNGNDAFRNYLARSNMLPKEDEEQEKQGNDKPEKESTLVMANVTHTLNVREEPGEESAKVGFLYRDCGGEILDRRDGWTKIRSGDLTGWASDQYLLFGEEAEALANEVGNLIVQIQTDALRVRKEPNTESGVYTLLAQDDELDVIEQVNDDWISVDYEGATGYVSAEYVKLTFHIDQGETLEAVKAREKAEAEAKAKASLSVREGAVVENADDTLLLAALIQCEAGNQPFEGQVAVGAVVMNRIRSPGYPNTLAGVIYASGQFTPAYTGAMARVYNSGKIRQSCIQAAQAAMAGADPVFGAMHFRRAGAHLGFVIGNHVFW